MGINLGEVFPNFKADTTDGKIQFHDWLGDSWGILFSHPADYTPVCTTELGYASSISDEFTKRKVKLIGLSCDTVENHKGWIKDIMHYTGLTEFKFPIIDDKKRDLAVALGMLEPDEKDKDGVPLTCRAVFIVGPDKKLKLSMLYPDTTGRNFNEILRVVDSLRLTAEKKVATPVNWTSGDKCMVVPSMTDEQAKSLFRSIEWKDVPSKKLYLRLIPDPSE